MQLSEEIKITSLNQYQQLAFRTWKELNEPIKNSLHCVTGIATENYEYVTAADSVNEKEEIGDMAWFMVMYHKVHNIPLDNSLIIESTTLPDQFTEQLPDCIHALINMDKAALVYDRPYDREVQVRVLACLWVHWVDACFMLDQPTSYRNGETPLLTGTALLFDVLETNIKKLMARFPEKYSNDNANNRDLDTERKVLENGQS